MPTITLTEQQAKDLYHNEELVECGLNIGLSDYWEWEGTHCDEFKAVYVKYGSNEKDTHWEITEYPTDIDTFSRTLRQVEYDKHIQVWSNVDDTDYIAYKGPSTFTKPAPNKLIIETDLTSKNTDIFLDGVQIGRIKRLDLRLDIDDTFGELILERNLSNPEGPYIDKVIVSTMEDLRVFLEEE